MFINKSSWLGLALQLSLICVLFLIATSAKSASLVIPAPLEETHECKRKLRYANAHLQVGTKQFNDGIEYSNQASSLVKQVSAVEICRILWDSRAAFNWAGHNFEGCAHDYGEAAIKCYLGDKVEYNNLRDQCNENVKRSEKITALSIR